MSLKNILDIKITSPTVTHQAVVKGGTFVALAGGKFDGRTFIPEAIKKGAKLIIYHNQSHWASRIKEYQRANPEVTFLGLDQDPRLSLTEIAQKSYSKLPPHLLAITGTNGKTSTAYFVYQLLRSLGEEAAYLGTNPFESTVPLTPSPEAVHTTTPDILALYRLLHECAQAGISTVCLEASSHGLHQGRLGNLQFQAAAFLNLTPEHLDYHATMEDYYNAKKLLFTNHFGLNTKVKGSKKLSRHFGAINIDDPYGLRLYNELSQDFAQSLKNRHLYLYPFGTTATAQTFGTEAFHLAHVQPGEKGINVGFTHGGISYEFSAPFFGDFQAQNLLAAIILTHYVSGYALPTIIDQIPALRPPLGRMERVATTATGAQVFVDYAHTPDALEKALKAIRCHTKGKVWAVFGCGGDRDAKKRPLMGEVAHRLADHVLVTDDNPRTENPHLIRQAIAAACPTATDHPDRRQAIQKAVSQAKSGDCVIICGKGHEEGQIIGTTTLPFSDIAVIHEILAKNQMPTLSQAHDSLWTPHRLQEATGGEFVGSLPTTSWGSTSKISFDSRDITPGDIFIAIKGHNQDGHAFVKAAVDKGAACVIVSSPLKISSPSESATTHRAAVLMVPDTQQALEDLGRYARDHLGQTQTKNLPAPHAMAFVAITGSYGKTSLKELLFHTIAPLRPTWANIKSYNNKWGVPITLANTPLSTQVGIYEVGTNQPGECAHLGAIVRPTISVITTIGHAHRENFPTHDDLVQEKASLMSGLEAGGIAILPSDLPEFPLLCAKGKEYGASLVLSFGWAQGSTVRILRAQTIVDTATPSGLEVELQVTHPKNHEVYNLRLLLPLHGEHWATLAAAAVTTLVALEITESAKNIQEDQQTATYLAAYIAPMETFREPQGRGRLYTLRCKPPKDGAFTFIDQTYNANPYTMASALRNLATYPIAPAGRRWAIVGEMFEVGTPEETQRLHAGLVEAIDPEKIHGVITVGPMAHHLHTALPPTLKNKYHVASGVDALALLGDLAQPGDVAMAKASNTVIYKKIMSLAKEKFTNAYDQALSHALTGIGIKKREIAG